METEMTIPSAKLKIWKETQVRKNYTLRRKN